MVTNAPVAYMSQYPKTFVKPIVTHDEQKELEGDGTLATLSHVPIRAALNSQSSSPLIDKLLNKFTNYVMEGGQKALARKIIEEGLEQIKRIQLERYHLADEEEKKNIELNPRILFHQAVENCRPLLRLTPVKRGGITYQVPIPTTENDSYFRSMKWLMEASNDKEKSIHFPQKFAWEVLDAAANTGRVVKKKQDLHKQCEANRAYAHYRWK